MQDLGTYRKLVVTAAELVPGDTVSAADSVPAAGTVTEHDGSLGVASTDPPRWRPVEAGHSYTVWRPVGDALASVSVAAADAIDSWSACPSPTFTCTEAAALRALLVVVRGPADPAVWRFDQWHASTDDDPDDCAHDWYLALADDPAASRP